VSSPGRCWFRPSGCRIGELGGPVTLMLVRPEQKRDEDDVAAVHVAAFPTSAEARLVADLRQREPALVSLVAEEGECVVGHILFSPVTIAGHRERRLRGLAPMAVVPSRQRSGIGSALVRAGLAECARTGIEAVVVLGHPLYYPRFGFVPASRFGLRSEYDVPDDVFLAIELVAGALQGATGLVRYHPRFASL